MLAILLAFWYTKGKNTYAVVSVNSTNIQTYDENSLLTYIRIYICTYVECEWHSSA